jgi:sulfonate transport system permease protein
MQRRGFTYGLAAFGGLLVLWWLASLLHWVNPFLLPSPVTVWVTGREMALNGQLWKHTAVSLQRVGLGYLLAATAAVPLALAFVISARFRAFAEPPLEFLRQIPPLALMPLLMLWLGIGEAQKVGIILLACFFPIFLGVRGGIAQVDPKLIEVGQSCGFGQAEILLRIVLPASLPAIVCPSSGHLAQMGA